MEGRKTTVVLGSDFGPSDGAGAVMEGVVKRINPDADIITLTHQLVEFDVNAAAFIILTNYYHFSPGTIFVIVVDPDVGTDRSIIVAVGENYCFIGPDNGLFWSSIEAEAIQNIYRINADALRSMVAIETFSGYFQRPKSSVFEGRDVMSVAAGFLSKFNFRDIIGEVKKRPDVFSKIEKDSLKKINFSLEKKAENIAEVGVNFVDSYGNFFLCTQPLFNEFIGDNEFVISVGGKKISHISKTYDDGGEGEPMAIFGGDFEHPDEGPFLSISINMDNAAEKFGVKVGDKIVIERR
jgi:S-adenosylmethionine hydrolase